MIFISFVDVSGCGAIGFGFTERTDIVLVLWNENFLVRTDACTFSGFVGTFSGIAGTFSGIKD
jgi:hypothetical protein